MIDEYADEACYVANHLEELDTLSGYRGAKTIRTLISKYEGSVVDGRSWHNRFKEAHNARNELVVAVNEMMSGIAGTLEALAGCAFCNKSATTTPYCHGCLLSIAKAAADLQQ